MTRAEKLARKLSPAQRREVLHAAGFAGGKSWSVQHRTLPSLVRLGILREGIPSEWGAMDYDYTKLGKEVVEVLRRDEPESVIQWTPTSEGWIGSYRGRRFRSLRIVVEKTLTGAAWRIKWRGRTWIGFRCGNYDNAKQEAEAALLAWIALEERRGSLKKRRKSS